MPWPSPRSTLRSGRRVPHPAWRFGVRQNHHLEDDCRSTMPSAGSLMMDGRDISRLPPNRREVGMVFQNYALFPHMNVADNIAFGMKQRGAAESARCARVAELLDLVQLPGYQKRFPAELSGGQRQRVAIARAVAHPPRVLLMDEPLGALDLKMRENMQRELRAIQRRLGITTIYVTHDQTEAMVMSRPHRGDEPGPGGTNRDPGGHLPAPGHQVRCAIRRSHQPVTCARLGRRSGRGAGGGRLAGGAAGAGDRRPEWSRRTARGAPGAGALPTRAVGELPQLARCRSGSCRQCDPFLSPPYAPWLPSPSSATDARSCDAARG